jgi:hypothetical protein
LSVGKADLARLVALAVPEAAALVAAALAAMLLAAEFMPVAL